MGNSLNKEQNELMNGLFGSAGNLFVHQTERLIQSEFDVNVNDIQIAVKLLLDAKIVIRCSICESGEKNHCAKESVYEQLRNLFKIDDRKLPKPSIVYRDTSRNIYFPQVDCEGKDYRLTINLLMLTMQLEKLDDNSQPINTTIGFIFQT